MSIEKIAALVMQLLRLYAEWHPSPMVRHKISQMEDHSTVITYNMLKRLSLSLILESTFMLQNLPIGIYVSFNITQIEGYKFTQEDILDAADTFDTHLDQRVNLKKDSLYMYCRNIANISVGKTTEDINLLFDAYLHRSEIKKWLQQLLQLLYEFCTNNDDTVYMLLSGFGKPEGKLYQHIFGFIFLENLKVDISISFYDLSKVKPLGPVED